MAPQPQAVRPRKNRTARNANHPAASATMTPTVTGSTHPLAVNDMHESEINMAHANTLSTARYLPLIAPPTWYTSTASANATAVENSVENNAHRHRPDSRRITASVERHGA